VVEIFQRDKFNLAELERYLNAPNMGNFIASIELGFFQSRKHKYIYIVSNSLGG
jgi:hypothetical protein